LGSTAADMRQVNKAGIELIKEFEGCRLDPYQDSAGFWTIGIGHLIKLGEVFTKITPERAEELLHHDLQLACKDVEEAVTIPINDNQFAALVAFAYNCGGGALRMSTLLKFVNAGNMDAAECEFPRWNKAGGKVVAGLTRRRFAEAKLFSTPLAEGQNA
jgi:lysozyme